MLDTANWPLPGLIGALLAGALLILWAGTRVTRLADQLADSTGLGEALFGAVMLGATTSLPGIVTSVTAAMADHPALAVSNAMGGIAVQTAFLAVADMSYRKVNLEHAAASLENLVQGALLIVLLAVPLLAQAATEVTWLGVHPASVLLVLAYLGGLRLVAGTREASAWIPRHSAETVTDEPDPGNQNDASAGPLAIRFILFGLLVGAAGYVVARSGIALSERALLSETAVGMLITAVVTSLPELVTSVAAVRQGALTLAVGGIIGGNVFDILFLAFADVAYREGSLYHAMGQQQVFTIALTQLLTGVLLLGLLRREKAGLANIGFESILVLVLYLSAVVVVALGGIGGQAP